MSAHDYKTQQNESQAFATVFFLKQDFCNLAPKFIYNTPGAIAQIKLQRALNNDHCVEEEIEINSLQQSRTMEGTPNQEKLDLEQLSGYAMDNIHYNTSQPPLLNSETHAQDTPEHEKHLPYEAWHVVNPVKAKKNTNGTKGLKKEIILKPDLKMPVNSPKNVRRRE